MRYASSMETQTQAVRIPSRDKIIESLITHDLRMDFSKVTQLLQDRDMSQADLGRRLGLTRASVSNWFTGKRTPTYGNLVRIAEVLGVHLSDILNDDAVLAETKTEKEIIELVQQINRETEISALWRYEHHDGLKMLISIKLASNTSGVPYYFTTITLDCEPRTIEFLKETRDELKQILEIGGVNNGLSDTACSGND